MESFEDIQDSPKAGRELKDDNYSRILSTFKLVYLTGLHGVQFGNNWMKKKIRGQPKLVEANFAQSSVRRLRKIIQRIFLLNQEPAFAESLGNGLERLVSHGLFYFYRKLSQLRFLPGLLRFAPTNCPWVSEDGSPVTN